MRIGTFISSFSVVSLLITSLTHAHPPAHAPVHGQSGKCETRLPPKSLNGYTVNYQILYSEADVTDAPYKGVIVSQYQKKHFKSQGTGTLDNNTDSALEYLEGNYSYEVVDCNKAIETATLQTSRTSRRTTQLIFTSPQAGVWEQSYDHGRMVLSGKFSLINSDARATAPESNAGFHHALVIKSTRSDLPPGAYPRAGRVVHTYGEDGTTNGWFSWDGQVSATNTFAYEGNYRL
jgi:hypothetical protein